MSMARVLITAVVLEGRPKNGVAPPRNAVAGGVPLIGRSSGPGVRWACAWRGAGGGDRGWPGGAGGESRACGFGGGAQTWRRSRARIELRVAGAVARALPDPAGRGLGGGQVKRSRTCVVGAAGSGLWAKAASAARTVCRVCAP